MAPHLLPKTRAQIVALCENGASIYKIAHQFLQLHNIRIHPSTISRICKRYCKTRSFYSSNSKAGRPRVLKHADARFAMLQMARTRGSSVAKIQREYFPEVSANTVRRCLRKLGIYAYARRRVPFLNSHHQRGRLAWATDHAAWLERDWRRVIFSDESKFNLFGSDGRRYVWRRQGQEYNPRYTQKMVEHGGGSVMVWGCITRNGPGRLHLIEGRMTARVYTQILEEELLGTLANYHLSKRSVLFQHDNDPKHTAKHTTKWLANKSLSTFPWPSNSPDMNIIEHVWDYLDRQVHLRSPPPQNTKELYTMLKEEWNCIPMDFINQLYDSMPRRLDELIVAKGGNTHY
ncbi:Transposable element Tcb2 transposase [Rhizoctonia solani]|uniref:Transposable element Tcb2 transposase n=1 Tax=Rhizoctonia solani TaxID=456999 RepID=A0A8H8SSI9_9AGAM|nr:Transposable element Tcb2 transposase [Rhizoctonia solani]QRW16629.1 Transposable element Tcb2 transposase [Rhizoctonia solani]